MPASLKMGLGLLSIGRSWGVHNGEPPKASDALELLKTALNSGIDFFDTAPAYGSSEALLGQFLNENRDKLEALTIATKVGEHWVPETSQTRVDHCYDALVRSIDQSLELLPKIDLLQIHKCSMANIAHDDTLRAIEYAKRCGITRIGASVSDIETGQAAIGNESYSAIQFPLNKDNPHLSELAQSAHNNDVLSIINRPFAMGSAVAKGDVESQAIAAYAFVKKTAPSGIVLTGTRSPSHLRDNQRYFEVAR